MKNILFFFSAILLLGSCKNEVVEKPAKLIDEDQMVNIIYDLALLEAIKSQYQISATENQVNPKEYIYKKYNIDSLQFAQSNHYYASDIGNYKKMYDKVSQRLADQQKLADSLAKKNNKGNLPSAKPADSDTPRVE